MIETKKEPVTERIDETCALSEEELNQASGGIIKRAGKPSIHEPDEKRKKRPAQHGPLGT